MTDCVHAAVDEPELARAEPVVDRGARHAERDELRAGDDAVLAGREERKPRVDAGRFAPTAALPAFTAITAVNAGRPRCIAS